MDLDHVLFIGGATGSGKTSISRALAYRYDLQLYNVDHRTYDHVERLPRPPVVRWDLPPDVLAEHFVDHARERWPLVLEDLAGLPDSPGAIAEGPFLLPELLPSGAQALYLVPDESRGRDTLAARGHRPHAKALLQRNVLLGARIRAAAERRGFAVVEVDRPLDGMIRLVDERLGPALAGLPRAVDRPAVRRLENDVLARQVRLWRASGDAPPGDTPLPFGCECASPGCSDAVELTLDAYEALSGAGDRSPLRAPRS
jgi:hypothetical protein